MLEFILSIQNVRKGQFSLSVFLYLYLSGLCLLLALPDLICGRALMPLAYDTFEQCSSIAKCGTKRVLLYII